MANTSQVIPNWRALRMIFSLWDIILLRACSWRGHNLKGIIGRRALFTFYFYIFLDKVCWIFFAIQILFSSCLLNYREHSADQPFQGALYLRLLCLAAWRPGSYPKINQNIYQGALMRGIYLRFRCVYRLLYRELQWYWHGHLRWDHQCWCILYGSYVLFYLRLFGSGYNPYIICGIGKCDASELVKNALCSKFVVFFAVFF